MQHALLFKSPADIHAAVGQEVLVTDWLEVTQARIDAFAEATGDYQWIHVDRERAARESPYGRTIAHGFLTLSLLGQWYEDYMTAAMPFYDLGLNYGLNKVRFTNTCRSAAACARGSGWRRPRTSRAACNSRSP